MQTRTPAAASASSSHSTISNTNSGNTPSLLDNDKTELSETQWNKKNVELLKRYLNDNEIEFDKYAKKNDLITLLVKNKIHGKHGKEAEVTPGEAASNVAVETKQMEEAKKKAKDFTFTSRKSSEIQFVAEDKFDLLNISKFCKWQKDNLMKGIKSSMPRDVSDKICSALIDPDDGDIEINKTELVYSLFQVFMKPLVILIHEKMVGNIRNQSSIASPSYDEVLSFLGTLLLMNQFNQHLSKCSIFSLLSKTNPEVLEVMPQKRFDELLEHLSYCESDSDNAAAKTKLDSLISCFTTKFTEYCCSLDDDNLNLDDLVLGGYSENSNLVAKVFMHDRKKNNIGYRGHVVSTTNLGIVLGMHFMQDTEVTNEVCGQIFEKIGSILGIYSPGHAHRWGICSLDRGYTSE
jgi:hypothetical protein